MNVPDLENSFMLLNYNSANRWKTSIEAVLAKEGSDGEEKYAYLSHECRAESVGENPFEHADEEFLGIKTWSGNYVIGAGSSLFRQNPKYQTRKVDNKHIVSCEKRNAQLLRFDEVLSNLQTDFRYGYKQLYTEFIYTHLGATYRLYTPCRYLNYPNPGLETKKYLQPIFGHVLFEEEEQFYLAYVVAHIADGKTKTIQFRLKEQTNYFKTISNPGRKLKLAIKLLPTFLYTSGYQRVVHADSTNMQCRFFTYS